MDEEMWTAVDSYLSDALIGNDDALNAAQQATADAGMPAISVSPTQGKMLQILATAVKARWVLEIGTLGGYSTIWLARGIAAGGSIVTLENDPTHAAVARSNIARAGFDHVVEVRLGSALDSLADLSRARTEPFDLVFIDADKPNIPSYFEWALKLTHPGSMILVDNVIRDGDVIDGQSADKSTQGVRRFFEMVSATPGVIATAIQTVGAKGYDGFAILMVK